MKHITSNGASNWTFFYPRSLATASARPTYSARLMWRRRETTRVSRSLPVSAHARRAVC